MNEKLVSVICLCHNHSNYLRESLQSVLDQTYSNIELIIVDDGSTDGSKDRIDQFLANNKGIRFINNPEPRGNCTAFNQGWKLSSGDVIVDFAADDVLETDRVKAGVQHLIETGASVHFSDAWLIDELGVKTGRHNERFFMPIPEGDLFSTLVRQYLICPPTMMFKREVIEYLNGYDESLAYEDFDFWVRSSREFQYAFLDEPLVRKRIVKNSHSRTQTKMFNSHQRSTLAVCKKIPSLLRTEEDRRALRTRCWHEIRQCIKKGNLTLIPDYLFILKQC